MIDYIVTSHGDFAEGIKNSSFMIFGEQKNVEAVVLHPNESPEELTSKFQEALAKFDKDDQVIFLVDLFGGSPFNAASQIVAEHTDRMALITGLNLSMLVEAYTVREQPLDQVVPHLEETAKAGVRHLEIKDSQEG